MGPSTRTGTRSGSRWTGGRFDPSGSTWTATTSRPRRRNHSRRLSPVTATLPPGVSASAMEGALAAFTAALGQDAVLTSEQDLREFRDPYAYVGWDEFTASAVVMPGTVE